MHPAHAENSWRCCWGRVFQLEFISVFSRESLSRGWEVLERNAIFHFVGYVGRRIHLCANHGKDLKWAVRMQFPVWVGDTLKNWTCQNLRKALTKWTWVWASSRRWWRTGTPGGLQSLGSPRGRPDWATEHQPEKQQSSGGAGGGRVVSPRRLAVPPPHPQSLEFSREKNKLRSSQQQHLLKLLLSLFNEC